MITIENRSAIPEELRRRIKREFFQNAALVLRWELVGQTIRADGKVVIGAQAGPSCEAASLCHEMSHFVEVDEPRMAQYGWGLKVPEVWIYDRMCAEPRTLQMTLREVRVHAFQLNVMDYLGIGEPVLERVESLTFLPDFILVPLEDGSKAWGARRRHKLSNQEVEASQLRWLAAQVTKARKTYTFERFLSEWKRRNAILKG